MQVKTASQTCQSFQAVKRCKYKYLWKDLQKGFMEEGTLSRKSFRQLLQTGKSDTVMHCRQPYLRRNHVFISFSLFSLLCYSVVSYLTKLSSVCLQAYAKLDGCPALSSSEKAAAKHLFSSE